MAAVLIDEHGSQGFTVEQLLEKSNISKGSLYHHFEDFHDVIMHAQVQRFARYVEEDIEALTRVLLAASSREDMFDRLDLISRATHDAARSVRRADRIEILAGARHSEKMKNALAPTQARLTVAIADLVREMKTKISLAKILTQLQLRCLFRRTAWDSLSMTSRMSKLILKNGIH